MSIVKTLFPLPIKNDQEAGFNHRCPAQNKLNGALVEIFVSYCFGNSDFLNLTDKFAHILFFLI